MYNSVVEVIGPETVVKNTSSHFRWDCNVCETLQSVAMNDLNDFLACHVRGDIQSFSVERFSERSLVIFGYAILVM